MAKNFIFRKVTETDICLDYCSYLGNGTRIGSLACSECINHVSHNCEQAIITCPKIMYRHYTGKVVMRKK